MITLDCVMTYVVFGLTGMKLIALTFAVSTVFTPLPVETLPPSVVFPLLNPVPALPVAEVILEPDAPILPGEAAPDIFAPPVDSEVPDPEFIDPASITSFVPIRLGASIILVLVRAGEVAAVPGTG